MQQKASEQEAQWWSSAADRAAGVGAAGAAAAGAAAGATRAGAGKCLMGASCVVRTHGGAGTDPSHPLRTTPKTTGRRCRRASTDWASRAAASRVRFDSEFNKLIDSLTGRKLWYGGTHPYVMLHAWHHSGRAGRAARAAAGQPAGQAQRHAAGALVLELPLFLCTYPYTPHPTSSLHLTINQNRPSARAATSSRPARPQEGSRGAAGAGAVVVVG